LVFCHTLTGAQLSIARVIRPMIKFFMVVNSFGKDSLVGLRSQVLFTLYRLMQEGCLSAERDS
jgi:hypothetical protein